MNSIVYLFSQFTSEAMLIESIVIFTLLLIYSGFWILQKRKYGSTNELIPASVVREFIKELVGDAQTIHTQFFGTQAGPLMGESVRTVSAPDPEMGKKIEELES